MNNQRGMAVLQIVWTIAGVLVIVCAGWFLWVHARDSAVTFATPYQAVLLINGSVYFGHLQGYGTSRPVLTDVYYIVTQNNAQTKETNNVLVKRGKELHEPDRMYLTPNQIVFVEPVGPNSKVAQLIAQAAH